MPRAARSSEGLMRTPFRQPIGSSSSSVGLTTIPLSRRYRPRRVLRLQSARARRRRISLHWRVFWSMGWLLGHPPLFGSNFAIRTAAWHRIRESCHRDVRELHDDLDLSFQFTAGMRVEFDRNLRVGVSSRPFGTFRGLGRRLYWAYTTIATNAREQSLLERRAERLRWAREHEVVAPTFLGDDHNAEYGPEELGEGLGAE